MRAAICDDELKIRESIEWYIKLLYPDFDVISFASAEELLEYMDKIDILFLDIQMSGISGMEAAKELRRRENDVTIIFVTGVEEYVFEAFDVGALHYLVKPFDKVKFFEVLKKAIKEREMVNVRNNIKEEPGIIIKKGATTSKIYLCDICCIEVFNRKLLIHKKNETVEIYGTLSDFEGMLSDDFVRCHRANIVNLRYVQDYDKKTIYLENGQSIMMSKQKYPEFVKRYMQWMQDMHSQIKSI